MKFPSSSWPRGPDVDLWWIIMKACVCQQETAATVTTAPPPGCCLQEAFPKTCRIRVLLQWAWAVSRTSALWCPPPTSATTCRQLWVLSPLFLHQFIVFISLKCPLLCTETNFSLCFNAALQCEDFDLMLVSKSLKLHHNREKNTLSDMRIGFITKSVSKSA